VDLAAGLAIVVIAVVVVWRALVYAARPAEPSTTTADRTRLPQPVPTDLISLTDAFERGDSAAKVVIVEYADLECPACSTFAKETFRPLMAKYVETGRARFAFRHFPLPNHPMARPAAIAAQCAAEQDKFWEFYEGVFQRQVKLDDTVVLSLVKSLGLNRNRWSACLKGDATRTVEKDFDEARKLKLRGTPTFVIGRAEAGGQMRPVSVLVGAKSLLDFDLAVAEAEKQSSGSNGAASKQNVK
jgi:protein-disulfide isomerase